MKYFILVALLITESLLSETSHKKFSFTAPLNQDDTWTLQQVLSQNIDGSLEGSAVTFSADGNTLAAGGASKLGDGTGQIQIYARLGTHWTHQATLSQNVTDSGEGAAVALSADGTTLAAGAQHWKDAGATQIYIRDSHNQWTHQSTLSQQKQLSAEGTSVALSADGTTLAAGMDLINNFNGATSIYVRSETTWSYQTSLSQNRTDSGEGLSVTLSADGNTLAAGAPGYRLGAGATQVYVQSDNGWMYQATLSQIVKNAREGWSVALSADGNTLAVGTLSGAKPFGATQIYIRSGDSWAHQATLSQSILNSYEGSAVALSADGNTLAAGAQGYNNKSGAVIIYKRSGTTWTYQATLIQNAHDLGGYSVALSADNSTLAAGSNFNPGATFVYVDN